MLHATGCMYRPVTTTTTPCVLVECVDNELIQGHRLAMVQQRLRWTLHAAEGSFDWGIGLIGHRVAGVYSSDCEWRCSSVLLICHNICSSVSNWHTQTTTWALQCGQGRHVRGVLTTRQSEHCLHVSDAFEALLNPSAHSKGTECDKH
jgi:hypothetical protein